MEPEALRAEAATVLLRGDEICYLMGMSMIVTPTDDGRTWSLTDLLGRPMGQIKEASAEQFTIHPEGHALETMAGLKHGPFASLDAALAAIEKHTRGVCRRNPGEDQP